MTPDFALSLSFEGISFMCRVEGGWHLLGEVPLIHADLDGAMAELRSRGEKAAKGPALCKIIIPNDQIKYLNLTTSGDDIEAQVLQELRGATPYAIDDLAFDYVASEGSIQVAAVARETLAEALDFALEHGFSAVLFTAMPEPGSYLGEPNFGPTEKAASLLPDGETPTTDETAIEIVSEGPEPPDTSWLAPDMPAPSFATSRRLAADAGAPASVNAAKLPGASRDANEAPKTGDEAEDAPSQIGEASTRFDPATVVAGLKKRPTAEPKERLRGAARSAPKVIPDGGAKPPAPNPKRTKVKKADPMAAAVAADQVNGKPKFLGLILLTILIVFLAGVAAWASLFTEDGIAGLFKRETVPQIAMLPDPEDSVDTEALAPTTPETITDSAEIEAMDDNEGIVIDPVLEAVDPAPTGEAFYAATGIWDSAPVQPMAPTTGSSEGIYLGAFEPPQQTHDAIALPLVASFGVDPVVPEQNNPVAAGIKIELDERGLVIATPEGALSPEGVLVYLGKPAVLPPAFPERVKEPEPEVTVDPAIAQLAAFRPKSRPQSAAEENERVALGGSTRSELAKLRPKARPERAPEVEVVSVDPAAIAAATDQAVLASLKPRARPEGLGAKLRETQTAKAVPQSQVTVPSIPTTASVARNATEKNAINLRKINLIGVYGTASNRRALVRLSSGRYKKVKVGDRIDGGKVAAISDDELRYIKGSRSVVLKMPKG